MITTHEVRNVLRVYGNHLKKNSSRFEESGSAAGSADFVDISMNARRRQMLGQISNQLISRMVSAVERNPEEKQQVSAPKLLTNEAG